MMPWPDESLALVSAAFIGRWVYRHRSALMPFTIALATFILAAMAHPHHAVWWIPVAILTVILTIALGVPHGLLRRYQKGRGVAVMLARLWQACGIDRPSERVYAAVVAAVTGGWLAAGIGAGPGTHPLPWIALSATGITGIPWWCHRRRRAKVRIEKIIDTWPSVADNIGLPGSRIISTVVDAWGWTARVALRKGTTAREAIGKTPEIESGLGLVPGTVRVSPDPARADRVIVRVIETDPHSGPIPWPGPVTTSVTQPAELGLFEDGHPARVLLLRRNILIGGTTGSGKSGIVNVILAILTACPDVVIWGVDLKGGMELGPWASCLERLATTPGEAVRLFEDGIRWLNDRATQQAAQGSRVWESSRTHPALVIVVDEYAELPAEATECADSIARRGRAVAVNLLAATQRPSQDAMGNNAVRSQMDVRICLRVREPRDADLILGQGSVTAGWHAHSITRPGVFLVSAPEHTQPQRALAYLVDDARVTRHTSEYHTGRPVLGPPPGAPESTQPGEDPQPGTTTPPDPDKVLWDALSAAGPRGVPAAHLAKVTGKGRTWVYERLRQLAGAGRVVQTIRGRWRAADTAQPPGGEPVG
jgi:S-DNA-T family DNA segregation ATPase FtsK/SpoIIIE